MMTRNEARRAAIARGPLKTTLSRRGQTPRDRDRQDPAARRSSRTATDETPTHTPPTPTTRQLDGGASTFPSTTAQPIADVASLQPVPPVLVPRQTPSCPAATWPTGRLRRSSAR